MSSVSSSTLSFCADPLKKQLHDTSLLVCIPFISMGLLNAKIGAVSSL